MASETLVLKRGAWVVQTRGPNRGAIGLIHAIYEGPKRYCTPALAVVQFGSGGPYRRLQEHSLRAATADEIAKEMGCRPRDLTSRDLVGVTV